MLSNLLLILDLKEKMDDFSLNGPQSSRAGDDEANSAPSDFAATKSAMISCLRCKQNKYPEDFYDEDLLICIECLGPGNKSYRQINFERRKRKLVLQMNEEAKKQKSKKAKTEETMTKLTQKERKEAFEVLRRYSPITISNIETVKRIEKGFDRNIHDFQKKFIDDKSKFILLCAGRRGGKTFGIFVKATRVCESHKGAVCWFIARTRERVKEIFWQNLKDFNTMFKLGIDFDNSMLEAKFPTGSIIKLRGCDEITDADKFRGGTKNLLFVLDEVASFRDKVLEYLMTEAIDPALNQFRQCQAIISGTPGNTKTGFFFSADQRNNPKSKWSSYTFDVLNNPYYTDWVHNDGPLKGLPYENWQTLAVEHLRQIRERNGYSETNPKYLREWKAQWSTSKSDFYYLFDEQKNVIDSSQIPDDLKYVVGIDIGTRVDPTAMIVIGYNENVSQHAYVVQEITMEAPVIHTDIYKTIKDLETAYNPESFVIDFAGTGDLVIQEVSSRYDIFLEDAKKSGNVGIGLKNKSGITELMNSELYEQRLLISSDCKNLIHELKTVRFDDQKKELDGSIPNDHCDALQYCWFKTSGYLHKPEKQKMSKEERLKQEIKQYHQAEDNKIIEERDQQQLEWELENSFNNWD